MNERSFTLKKELIKQTEIDKKWQEETLHGMKILI